MLTRKLLTLPSSYSLLGPIPSTSRLVVKVDGPTKTFSKPAIFHSHVAIAKAPPIVHPASHTSKNKLTLTFIGV
jgi:hypothetical protein